MQVSKTAAGSIEIDVNRREMGWLAQTLNECCHGFSISDFTSKIGADKPAVTQFLDQILAAFPPREASR